MTPYRTRCNIVVAIWACFAITGFFSNSAFAVAGDSFTTLRSRIRLDSGWRFHLDDPSISADEWSGNGVTQWRWSPDDKAPDDAAAMAAPSLDTSGWKLAASGDDVFHGRIGYVWMRSTVTAAKVPSVLHFESVDDNATVYLNGKLLGSHKGWMDAFDVPVGDAWSATGPNTIAVLVENTSGGGGIEGPVTLGAPIQHPAASRPAFDDSSWRTVHLPHDFVVEGLFHPEIPNAKSAWYRNRFTIPATTKGRDVWLDFDGVFRNSKVWLNGELLGVHPCGYTGFRYDISSAAHYGQPNELVVEVNKGSEGWWYEGGGIYRHVWLNIASPVRVADDGIFVTSKIAGLESGAKPSATITVSMKIANGTAEQQPVTVTLTVVRPDGTVLAAGSPKFTVAAANDAEFTVAIAEPSPALWSLETPHMYKLRTVVSVAGKSVDSVETPFGLRSIRFDAATGFYLNEKPVKIKGTCNHQDFAGIGIALPDGILAWRVAKLKSMGCNAYRTSHNEVAPELLDECDKQGMLVMDETRHFGDGEAGKASADTPATELSNLRQQVLRDRNHPSVIMWSIGNEEGVQGTDAGLRIATAMKALVKQLDPTRPVTLAMNGGIGKGASTILDVQGFNYQPGSYAWYHKTHPDQCIMGSETASAVGTRGCYTSVPFSSEPKNRLFGDKANGWVSAYDLSAPGWAQTAQEAWLPIATQQFVAGGFVWTGFDYRGEPTPYSGPQNVNSAFGILDTCGFPKDSFYYYQSVWGDKPIVHVFPHWNWAGKEGQPINVWAYTNADNVELFVNGKSVGTMPVPKYGHVEWNVPYVPGEIVAKATTGGKEVASDTVKTTRAPAAIRLRTDRPQLIADGEDESPVDVSIVDADGNVVPTADNLVTFSITGAGDIAGVGNGNPSSHEADVATLRRAFNGLCMAVVRARKLPGSLRLTATADGLVPASIDLTAVNIGS